MIRKKPKVILVYEAQKPWKWVSDSGLNQKVVYTNA